MRKTRTRRGKGLYDKQILAEHRSKEGLKNLDYKKLLGEYLYLKTYGDKYKRLKQKYEATPYKPVREMVPISHKESLLEDIVNDNRKYRSNRLYRKLGDEILKEYSFMEDEKGDNIPRKKIYAIQGLTNTLKNIQKRKIGEYAIKTSDRIRNYKLSNRNHKLSKVLNKSDQIMTDNKRQAFNKLFYHKPAVLEPIMVGENLFENLFEGKGKTKRIKRRKAGPTAMGRK